MYFIFLSIGDNVQVSALRSPRWGQLVVSRSAQLTWDNTTVSGQDHDGLVTLQNGIQLFTVKHTGTYRIGAAGAAAGWGKRTPKSVRGRGSLMKGTLPLKRGEVLKILVGQEGVQDVPGCGVGGGGGTFVTRDDNTPLIIAGGGGGGNHMSARETTSDGTKETSGNPSSGGKVRGKDGNGAVKGASDDVVEGPITMQMEVSVVEVEGMVGVGVEEEVVEVILEGDEGMTEKGIVEGEVVHLTQAKSPQERVVQMTAQVMLL
ncbi:Hypp239 [Branchiostoma lanceolatum]|uniref:receptor protein-tyrosine kinase n=1 Tax=Branchiostoma lanceolatum TaxID=7740 RepID=A0A8J9YK05_BRALA|nr:Hypp239 [Branchiostoma lanceolatum]